MSASITDTLYNAIIKLLRPLVLILLRDGISYHVFTDIVRWVYVDVAFKEFGIPGRKQSTSRISVITGLSRKEVQKLREFGFPKDVDTPGRYNRAARVIGGWISDPVFLDQKKKPLSLPLEGTVSFSSLVRKYSGDMPVRAVLDELINVGGAELQDDGTVQLLTRAYLPSADKQAKLDILGNDVADLIATIKHNLEPGFRKPFFQRKVSYDNVPDEFVERFRNLSAQKSQRLLEVLNEWLIASDRDTNPGLKSGCRNRVGLGIYYFEENMRDEQENTPDGDER